MLIVKGKSLESLMVTPDIDLSYIVTLRKNCFSFRDRKSDLCGHSRNNSYSTSAANESEIFPYTSTSYSRTS